ncbi:MAG: hypothetical protein ACD_57C00161G0001 [uncultured bacterium]|nr:MAG: hypothetical protein ACD_57C00161G0001 [uncultured bacterium]
MVEARDGVVLSMVYAEDVKLHVFPEWNRELSKRSVTLNVPLSQLEGWIFIAGELANNYGRGESELGMDKLTKSVLTRRVMRSNYKEHVELFAVLLNVGAEKFYPDLDSNDDLAKKIKEGLDAGMLGTTADRNEVVALNMPLGVVRSLVASMSYQASTVLSMWENADINRTDLMDTAEFACRSLADILPQLKEQGVKVDTMLLGQTLLVVNVLDAM